MFLERTITQLDSGPMPAEEAEELGQLGYMQWMAGLSNGTDYNRAAEYAYERAAPYMELSPAVAAFCALLRSSIETPLKPLPLAAPPTKRRGGADARRSSRLRFR